MSKRLERQIRRAFREFRGGSEPFEVVEEHEQLWVSEKGTGGQWSVAEGIDPVGNRCFAFEQVSAPDED